MKKIFLIASLCAAMLSTACLETTYQDNRGNRGTTTTTTDTKNRFHSNNGKFSINFVNQPQGPIYNEEKNNAGMVQTYQYIDQVSDNAMYVAMYKDYPVGAVTASNTEEKLKAEAKSFMTNFGSKIENQADERLNGNKGLSFSGNLNDTISISMRSYFVGKRYYQFGTISANSEISEKDSKKFINSFELDN